MYVDLELIARVILIGAVTYYAGPYVLIGLSRAFFGSITWILTLPDRLFLPPTPPTSESESKSP